MRVTREFLRSGLHAMTLTQAQANILGLQFPPKSGWLKKIIGKEISDDVKNQFLIEGISEKTRRRENFKRGEARRCGSGTT